MRSYTNDTSFTSSEPKSYFFQDPDSGVPMVLRADFTVGIEAPFEADARDAAHDAAARMTEDLRAQKLDGYIGSLYDAAAYLRRFWFCSDILD